VNVFGIAASTAKHDPTEANIVIKQATQMVFTESK